MSQSDIKQTGRMAANEDCGARPMTRALTVAARGTMAAAAGGAVSHGSSPYSHSARPLKESPSAGDPAPVWMAVLMAAGCHARSLDLKHDICWNAVAGRATYTNFGRLAESIEPLGVSLPAGDTLAVYWAPGETEYTIEVYSDNEKCA